MEILLDNPFLTLGYHQEILDFFYVIIKTIFDLRMQKGLLLEYDTGMINVCVNSLPQYINRGSYMSAHVLLNVLNELGKRDKMRGLPSILSLFRNEFNKFNNTRARMLDSIYHMTNTLKSHFLALKR